MRSVHVPMSVADFIASAAFRSAFNLTDLRASLCKTCVCLLGLWDPHVATERDRVSLTNLVGQVDLFAVSSGLYEVKHLDVVKNLVEEVGLRPSKASQIFNCTEELLGEESHYDGD